MNFCAFYDEQYRNEMLKTTEIEQDMNEALSGKQFLMYLQPKYNLETGKICGAEVLARWKHPVKGLIQPNDFIPLFERNGFILKLDEYMWEEACKTLADWRAQGKTPVPLSVNISRYHIKNNDLVSVWKKLIRKYNIPTSDLTLEITETFFYDSSDLYDVLQRLQNMGFKLEVDDFGAGYSSLNMIRQIPVDTIKIDKDFLDKKLSTDKGKIVISHTIAMAKDLKLSVVAEGVETQEHVDFLKSSSCDIAQGFYFAKPMPLEDFNKLCYGE
jgi:EAL domain-containing protein (putative c-di-GMP-specific phosphodiesterase class I)